MMTTSLNFQEKEILNELKILFEKKRIPNKLERS